MTLAEACAESIWGPSRIPIKMWLSNAMQLLGEKANTIFRGQDVWKVINPPFLSWDTSRPGLGENLVPVRVVGHGDVARMDAVGCLKGLL